MMLSSKGSASVEMVIFITVVLVLFCMPIMVFALDKLILFHVVDEVVDTMEASLYSMTEKTDLSTLSDGSVAYNLENLETNFLLLIESNLTDYVDVEVASLIYYPYEAGALKCTPSKTMHYDTLHVEVKIDYHHAFYHQVLSKGNDREINFHFDLELPKNN